MKRQTKRVWKYFSYRECGAMERYLEEMGERGWHLKALGGGMLFEVGEPEKMRYSVNVFLKGSTYDTKPETDTKEFVEYCEAAGWEFVCNFGKTCVFRTTDQETVAIETDEENRFRWISKNEFREKLVAVICFLLLFAMDLRSIALEFDALFNNRTVIALVLSFLITGSVVIEFVEEKIWEVRSRKRLQLQEVPAYGRLPVWLRLIRVMPFYLCVLYVCGGAVLYGYYFELLIFAVELLVVAAVLVMILHFRPSRDENLLIQWAGAFLVPIIVASALTIMDVPGKDNTGEAHELPLTFSDFRKDAGEADVLIHEQMEGWLGRRTVCYIESKDEEQTLLHYEVTESPFAWVLDHYWKEEVGEAVVSEEDAALWEADTAARRGTYGADIYVLRYPGQIIVFQYEQDVTPEVISCAKEKLIIGR